MAFRLTNTDHVSDTSARCLDGARSVTTATVGGTTYLFVAGEDDDGVSVFAAVNNSANKVYFVDGPGDIIDETDGVVTHNERLQASAIPST